ncbi:hypothetical protein [Paenarthrobacter sp. NPDC091669]|uniref:hypothetical protein n=1 Tax=Paenarthrobacter sp. NPDC091669 TaxID=3364384 RepID=UPI00381DF6A5
MGTNYPAPEVLVVAPPSISPLTDAWTSNVSEGARAKTAGLAPAYREFAQFYGHHFFDAGSVVSTEEVDGLHLSEENNRKLGIALAREVQKILAS